MSASEVRPLPELPTRESLLRWLAGTPRQSFDLNAGRLSEGDDPALPVGPIEAYLKHVWGFTSVEAGGWTEFKARDSAGTAYQFSADRRPAINAYLRGLQIAYDQLSAAFQERLKPLSKDELAYLLVQWERPHETVDTIIRRRVLDGATDNRKRD